MKEGEKSWDRHSHIMSRDGPVQIRQYHLQIAAAYHGPWDDISLAYTKNSRWPRALPWGFHRPPTRIWVRILYTLKMIRLVKHKPTYFCSIESNLCSKMQWSRESKALQRSKKSTHAHWFLSKVVVIVSTAVQQSSPGSLPPQALWRLVENC